MKDNIRRIMIIILSGVLIFSLFKIIQIDRQNSEEDSEFKMLAQKVGVARENIKKEENSVVDSGNPENEAYNKERKQQEIAERLANYNKLHEENSDLFGWVTIDDSVIDYPVMFTPNDPEYYLHRSFSKKNTYSGCIFIDAKCDEGCNNYLLHGHHMKNGTMFAGLLKYKDKEYWKEHPVIKFDTLDEANEYLVIAAFESKVYKTEDDVFKYYNYTHMDGKDTFDEYMEGLNKLKLYDTGVDVTYEDEFITLSTCSYHIEDGRFVVVGVKKKN